MKRSGIIWTIINVAIYCAGALIIFGWLTIRASNGGLVSPSSANYRVVVPSAPGVEANKTSIISAAGVTIGVVTDVQPVERGAEVSMKLTDPGPIVVTGDASARIVITNIIGEKAVQLLAGKSKEDAKPNQMLAYAGQTEVLEASDALAPIDDIRNLPVNPEVQGIIDDAMLVFNESSANASEIISNVSVLGDMLASQKVALDQIGGRTSELLAVLAARSGDIQSIIEQSALLAADVETLLANEAGVLEKGFTLAADAVTMLADNAGEMNTILEKLPGIATTFEEASEQLLNLLYNIKGEWVYIGARNVPILDEILIILQKGGY